MTSFASQHPITPTSTSSPALVRFVTTGLLATIDSYRAGALPPHRFVWELQSRIDTLARLHTPARVVTRLRWLQRTVERLHTKPATGDHAELSGDEENSLTLTLSRLRTVLATLSPRNPLDPTGAAHPHPPTQPALPQLIA